MRSRVVPHVFAGCALAVVLAVVLAGCGAASSEEDPRACPSYAADDGTGAGDFIVRFREGSGPASSAEERADLVAGVAERTCLGIDEVRQLGSGSFLVSADRRLDGAGQHLVVSAFEESDEVEYAEVDAEMTTG